MRELTIKILLSLSVLVIVLAHLTGCTTRPASETGQRVLQPAKLQQYVRYFNGMEPEDVVNYVPNAQAQNWLEQNVPLFECPDSLLEATYYYRWWTFRKHLKQTPDGFVFTEFITPVSHAAKHNAISCALGHHIYEGRWLHNQDYLDQYVKFWLLVDPQEPKPKYHAFSSWLADALYQRYLVDRDQEFLLSMLPLLDADYKAWTEEKRLENGLYWQFDVRDGMEESVSGSRREKNMRPTINSYMYGYAKALGRIADLAGNEQMKREYEQKAAEMKDLVQTRLWDEQDQFFKTRMEAGHLHEAREAIGFIPWYFNLPEDSPKYAEAWRQMLDSAGFASPWGLTTAERREPSFRTRGTGRHCEWDGAVWPFASTQTLKGLANLLTGYQQHNMTKQDYFTALRTYAWSHQKNGLPYIGEYQDEKTGYWLKGDHPRSSYYNHSGFTDLIINDLVGLKPQADNTVVVHPLVPEGEWDWFALDNVPYQGRILTILWDKDGKKYGRGKGLRVLANGVEVAKANTLSVVKGKLPE
jgi:hypothetical protein